MAIPILSRKPEAPVAKPRIIRPDSAHAYKDIQPFRDPTVRMRKIDYHSEQLAGHIAAHLKKHYRGHHFRVRVELEGGMAMVHLAAFSAWSYNIKLSDLWSDPRWDCVTRAGGELLERWRLPRTGIDVDKYVGALRAWKPETNWKTRPPD